MRWVKSGDTGGKTDIGGIKEEIRREERHGVERREDVEGERDEGRQWEEREGYIEIGKKGSRERWGKGVR